MSTNNDGLDVNLSNYQDRQGARVKPGRYRVAVQDLEASKTGEGKAMVNVYLSIVGGEFDGQTIVDRLLPEHPTALWRIVAFLQALGIKTPKKNLSIPRKMMINRVLEVDVDDGKPWKKKIKSEVQGFVKVEGGAKTQQPDLPADDTEEFVGDDEDDLDDPVSDTENDESYEDDEDDEPESEPVKATPAKRKRKSKPAPVVENDLDIDEDEDENGEISESVPVESESEPAPRKVRSAKVKETVAEDDDYDEIDLDDIEM